MSLRMPRRQYSMVEELKLGTLCSGIKSCELCFGGKELTSEFQMIRLLMILRAISSNMFLGIIESK